MIGDLGGGMHPSSPFWPSSHLAGEDLKGDEGTPS